MPLLTILHISDFHFSEKNAKESRTLQDALIRDILRQRSAGIRPDFIIFSGDLINAGGDLAAFNTLKSALLDPLCQATELTPNSLFLVPGNHDIDRNWVRENAPVQNGLLSEAETRDRLNAFYDKRVAQGAAEDFYFARQKVFSDFADAFGKPFRTKTTHFYRSYHMPLSNGLHVGILVLNTAWLCTGEANDADKGHLAIPERAIVEGLDDIKLCSFKIAAMHHPLDYLTPHNKRDCKALLQKNFNLVCNGHLHEAAPEVLQSPLGLSIWSAAGALYAGRNFYNGYNFICLDTDTRKVEFIYRKYEDAPLYEFVPNTAISEDGKTTLHWGDHEETRRVGNLIDLNKALKPILEEQANEHLLSAYTNTAAPKSLSEMFVEPPIAERSQYETEQTKSALTYVPARALLLVDEPVILFGGREIGKTTLAYFLALQACDFAHQKLRTPILIDLDRVSAGSGILARELKKVLALGQLQGRSDELLASGSFVFLFDSFRLNDRRKSSMISDFIAKYPKNAYLMFADEGPAVIGARLNENLGFERRELYLHQLKRDAVRELTRRWLEPAGLYSTTAFHTLMKRMRSSNLPATAYVVSMLAWTIERQNVTGNINEAALLERFVDAVLNKANPKDVSRSSLDYTIKETFLAELAHELVSQDKYVIAENDLTAFTLRFISERSWNNSAQLFLEDVIGAGVLWRAGGVIAFRYRCLREYFLAKYMIDHPSFRDHALSREQFLKFSREIDILTGLRRRDDDIIRIVRSHMNAIADELFKDTKLSYFDSIQLRSGDIFGLINRPTSLKEWKVTDAVVEKMLDDESKGTNTKDDSSDLSNRPKSDVTIEGMSAAYASAILMGKVLRNSELVVDAQLKHDAASDVIKTWSKMIVWLNEGFERHVGHDGKSSFENMPPRTQLFVDYFIKIFLPVVLSAAISESMSTEKLRSIFEGLFQQPAEPSLIERILIAFLLLDLSYDDHTATPVDAVRVSAAFIKQHYSPYVDELVSLKLLLLYLSPNIGDANRKSIESTYAELSVNRLHVKGRAAFGQSKSNVIKSLQEQREKSVVGIRGEDDGNTEVQSSDTKEPPTT